MKSRRLYWAIVEKIEKQIDEGVYPVGSRLPAERELVEYYDVSRPTIREAILALEVRGRVEVKTGSGVYVIRKDQAEKKNPEISAFELTQARALIEGEAAALAASTITPEELKTLHKTLEDMQNPELADKADQQFHEIISRATRNQAIVTSVENLWEMRRSIPQIVNAYADVCSQSSEERLAEHTRIYEAISQKNTADARRAMHKHFDRLINALFDASEAKALEEIKRKTDETRGLYSIYHLAQ